MSYAQFRNYLVTHHDKPKSFFDTNLLAKMKQYIMVSMDAVKKKLNPMKRGQCFEIFGYDFIFDAEFNTWLIEVNTNPCLLETSNLLE